MYVHCSGLPPVYQRATGPQRRNKMMRVRVGPEPKWPSRFTLPRYVRNLRREEKCIFKTNRHISSRSKSFVPAMPKCDVFREGCDKKRHKLKKIFLCARASHSSQKCDKCDASHFLSPEKVTNVTSLKSETGSWVEIRLGPTLNS